MITGPPPPPPPLPPAVHAPAPREVSFGRVAGRAPAGTKRIRVRVDGTLVADRPLAGRSFSLRVALPARDVTVNVAAVTAHGSSTTSVPHVFGLPAAAEPVAAQGVEDAVLHRSLQALARSYGGTSAGYVKDLRTGRGAAWNAGARFPAASTLKLAIAVAVLRRHDGVPAPGSRVESLLHAMLVRSDNAAANALETWLGGSIFGGAPIVNETMRAIGMADSEMYGGYVTRAPSLCCAQHKAPIPVRTEASPAFGLGKFTTAHDLALLAEGVYLGAVGTGVLVRRFHGAFTPPDARHLLWLLARTADRGKLDRFAQPGTVVLHKAGWLAQARHDSGILVGRRGVQVVSVLTWSPGAVGVPADVLAGRVARAAQNRFG
jgi:beta-lactamase class A